MKHEELETLYQQSESVDSQTFAEYRSNVLLASGDHFNRRNSKFWSRLRDNKDLSDQQRIRLTKNHIQKICKTYENDLLSLSPGVKVMPKSDSELSDVKAAELHNAVLADIKVRHNIQDKIRQWVKDFVEVGELCVYTFWDPMKGQFLGYEQETDEMGQPKVDEAGQPVQGKKPIFTGDFTFKRVFAPNLLRAPQAKTMEESPYFIIRDMVPKKEMEKRLAGDPERLKMLEAGRDETYVVFDGSHNGYSEQKDQCLLKSYFFKHSPEYPNGYFYISTNKGILWEGELPFGIYPIEYCGFDEVQTTPRGLSIIKVLRPYQAEISRASSKLAEGQITLGDDKVLIQSGTKIANGGFMPGVRAIQYTGAPPTILPGRSGEQYLPYIQAMIEEMYMVANLELDQAEKGDQDPMITLFKSMQQRKKYVIYAQKLENFLVNLFGKVLDMAKQYYTEDMLVPAIGKREYVNIAEFKSQEKICYQIQLEPLNDDAETLMGKQMTFQHILQYTGGQLSPEQIGNLVRNMPYANEEQAFEDLTLDYDNIKNDILAMDRGEYVPSNKYDNHEYIIKKLINRMKMADFKFLDPQIQQMYAQKLQEHEQVQAQLAQQIKAAQAEFIPSGGFMAVCDLYVPDPNNPGKSSRVKLPSESLQWLIDQLESQGSGLEAMAQQAQGVQADVAQMSMGQGGTPEAQEQPVSQDQQLAQLLQGQG